jgi:hypothetical protein
MAAQKAVLKDGLKGATRDYSKVAKLGGLKVVQMADRRALTMVD